MSSESLLLEPDSVVPATIADAPIAEADRSLRKRTLKVLHIVNGEHYAGAERVQDLLAMRLPDFGVEVTLACVKPVAFSAARQSQSTPLIETPMRFRFDLRPAWTLAKLIRHEQFDLIHTHTPRSALVGRWAARLAGVPLVHHVHGQTATEIGRGWRAWLAAQSERRSLTGATAVIAVSNSSAEYIEHWGVPRERIHLVPNGVPAAEKSNDNRQTPQGQWTLGTVALFRPRKGLAVLFEALAILHRRHVPVRLRVIGGFETPQYEQEIRQQAHQLGVHKQIEWRGFQSDIPAELEQLDLMVLPSLLAEGMPMVVLEAMAAGVPTIGSRVDGIADVIDDGRDGLLFEAGSAEALAESIQSVVKGHVDWQQLRRQAIAKHAAKYSDRQMAAGVAEIYRQVLEKPAN